MTTTITIENRNLLAELVAGVDFDEKVRRRAVQDAITGALAWQLRRRAEVFEAAAPRPEDFHGKASRDELAEAWRRCHGVALALRSKATLVELGLLDVDGERGNRPSSKAVA